MNCRTRQGNRGPLSPDDYSMEIGILSLRNNRYHPNRRLQEATKAMGHRAVLMHPGRFFLSADGLGIQGLAKRSLPHVVLPRIGSTIREYPLTLLRHLELMGVQAVNGYEAVSLARNKFLTLQTLALKKVPIPLSMYASNPENLRAAVKGVQTRPFVVKTSQGRQGRGVFLAKDNKEAEKILESWVEPGRGLVLQEYIPPEERILELRVLIVGGRCVGAMSLKPRPGDFRANIHMRGRAEPVRLPRTAKNIAIAATKALGLEISGIDMVQKKDMSFVVLDVNYSPGFKGLERCTGKDIASKIIKYVITPIGRAG